MFLLSFIVYAKGAGVNFLFDLFMYVLEHPIHVMLSNASGMGVYASHDNGSWVVFLGFGARQLQCSATIRWSEEEYTKVLTF